MKPGTRIETKGFPAFPGFPGVAPQRATIVRPTARNLPLPGEGWHIVKFADGGKLCMHEDSFRVVDNWSCGHE